MFDATYAPFSSFSTLAGWLVAVESRNSTDLESLVSGFLSYEADCNAAQMRTVSSQEAFGAISCADGPDLKNDTSDFLKYLSKSVKSSTIAGPIWANQRLRCEEWKLRPKSRYEGPFSSNTSHPILLVSNTFDPITPLSSAKKVARQFPGAVLLEQKGHGHCSYGAPSKCTYMHLSRYFLTGELPAEGTTCEVDILPFIGEVGNTTLIRKEHTMFLDAIEKLSRMGL
jgi:hypothetical protein